MEFYSNITPTALKAPIGVLVALNAVQKISIGLDNDPAVFCNTNKVDCITLAKITSLPYKLGKAISRDASVHGLPSKIDKGVWCVKVFLLQRFDLPVDFQVKDGQQRYYYTAETRKTFSGEKVVPVSMLVRPEHCHPNKADIEMVPTQHVTFEHKTGIKRGNVTLSGYILCKDRFDELQKLSRQQRTEIHNEMLGPGERESGTDAKKKKVRADVNEDDVLSDSEVRGAKRNGIVKVSQYARNTKSAGATRNDEDEEEYETDDEEEGSEDGNEDGSEDDGAWFN